MSDRINNLLQRAAEELGFKGSGMVVGIKIYGGGEGAGEPGDMYVTFQITDAGSVPQINERLAGTDGELVVKEYHKSGVPIVDIIRCFKRFNIALFDRHIEAKYVSCSEDVYLDDN